MISVDGPRPPGWSQSGRAAFRFVIEPDANNMVHGKTSRSAAMNLSTLL
jgi:hypothetical protein